MELEYNAEKNKLVNQDTVAEFERKLGNVDKQIAITESRLENFKRDRRAIQGLINEIKGLRRKLNNPGARSAGENEEFSKRIESSERRINFLFEKIVKRG